MEANGILRTLLKNRFLKTKVPSHFYIHTCVHIFANIGFSGGSGSRESACNAGDLDSIPGLGRSPGGGHGNPLQYSCLENSMARGAWWAAVHGVAKSWTRLSDFTFTFHFHALEKEMETHSSILAWRIPGMAEPGGLLSMGSHRGQTLLQRLSSIQPQT